MVKCPIPSSPSAARMERDVQFTEPMAYSFVSLGSLPQDGGETYGRLPQNPTRTEG